MAAAAKSATSLRFPARAGRPYDSDMAKRVLCIGRHQEIMDAVLTQLRDAGYEPAGAITIDGVVELAATSPFDALLIGGGMKADERDEVMARVRAVQPTMTMVQVSVFYNALEELREALERNPAT